MMAVSQTYLDQHTTFLESFSPVRERTVNHFCNTCDHLVYWKFYGADGVLLDAQWIPHSCDQIIAAWVMDR